MLEILGCSILLSLFLHGAGYSLFGFLYRKRIEEYGLKLYAISGSVSACASSAILFITAALLNGIPSVHDKVMIDYPGIFLTAALLCCIFSISGFMAKVSAQPNEKSGPYRIAQAVSVSTAVLLFCEIFVFNYLSFVPMFKNLPAGNVLLENAKLEGGAGFAGDSVKIGENGGSITLHNINWQTCCFQIQASGTRSVCSVSVDLSDDNFTKQTYYYGSYDFSTASPRTMVLPVFSVGKMKQVKFSFNYNCSELKINGITVNQPGFFFSWDRFFLLSAAAAAIIFIIRRKIWLISYRPSSTVHNTVIAGLAVLLCFISYSLGKTPFENKDIQYPLKTLPDDYSCYVQQFDAFQKGRLNLDLKVDPKLQKLRNPYDASARTAGDVYFAWDRSYYNGKYYSYFGVTPIFIVYYPYYFFHHALPYDLKAATILALLAIPVILLLVLELVQRYCKKVNFLLLLLGMAAAVFSSLLFVLQISADFYYLVYLSEILFVSLFLLLALYAARAPNGIRRFLLLLFSGIAYVLAVGSRPTAGLFIVLVVPVFWEMLADHEEKRKKKIIALFCFAVPVLVGAAAIMKFNFDRFGSPFEFGTTYQLTVDNMKYNQFSVLNILPAIYHYFFQLPSVDPQFPFIHAADKEFNYYASYKLHVVMLGVISFPCMWWIFGMTHVPVYRERKEARTFFWSVVLLSVFIAVLNFSVSGTDIRYIADFALLLSILSVIVILNADTIFTKYKNQHEILLGFRSLPYVLACFSFLVSILVGTAAIFSNERETIYFYDPGFYANLERLLMFW